MALARGKGVLAVAAAGLLAGGGTAMAAASPWADQEQAQVRLLAAHDTAGDSESLAFGLQFKLQPGWKIYWRSPGDAGYPPSVNWSGSENLADLALDWPVPHRFTLFGLQTFGYSDEVVLPVRARVERAGEAVRLNAAVDYLTCNEICIPRQVALSLDIPAGPAAPSPDAFLIDSFRLMVPGQGPNGGLTVERAVLGGTVEAPVVEVTARSETPFAEPDVLIEAPPGFSFDAPRVSVRDGGRQAVLRLAATATGGGILEGKRLTLTVTDGRRGAEREVIARFANPAQALPAPPAAGRTLAVILGLAFLGGLILNLMPCVLPVLSIKLLSVVNHGGRAPAAVRASFTASAAGILASFWLLGGAAIALKTLGMTVGWGIQFQQPLFLAAMAVVITLFACNLFGFFEFRLPAWAQGVATIGLPGGRRGPGEHSLAGHFLTGAFATLLATPCSAPFLGTAVGFALARGPFEILMIFTMLGLGLALPYLLIAAVPALAAKLPRPGAWMIGLRRVLGLALAATAVWLVSVLAAQIGAVASAMVGALLLALMFVVWLGRARHERQLATPVLAGLLAIAAIALPGLAGQQAPSGAATQGAESADGAWQPLDLAEVSHQVEAGNVVFVDVTADWCLTCQVNKKLVLDRGTVRDRLEAPGVVTMRGDWTLPSERISAYLESFGRYGIPFNAVYGPGAPSGLALPELLTDDAVLRALDQAAGG